MTTRCPCCGKAHRRYPWRCEGLVRSELAHVVIARAAGGQEPEGGEAVRALAVCMDAYLAGHGWPE